MSKKTVILGASPNPSRYSHRATTQLKKNGHEVVPLGIRGGEIEGETIQTDWPEQVEDLDTVTMYVGPSRQAQLEEYVIGLQPQRVIFNPGTENPEFYRKLEEANIPYEEACTLVLLSIGQY